MDKYTQVLLLCVIIGSVISSNSGSSSSNWIPIYNSTCDPNQRFACDSTQAAKHNLYKTYLKCSPISKRCDCEGGSQFDSNFDVCRINAKSLCSITSDAEGFKQVCTPNAMCAYPLDRSGNELKTAVQGNCKCNDGYATTTELTCSSTGSVQVPEASNCFIAILIGVLTTWIALKIS